MLKPSLQMSQDRQRMELGVLGVRGSSGGAQRASLGAERGEMGLRLGQPQEGLS